MLYLPPQVQVLWRSRRDMLLAVRPGLTREDSPFWALAALMYIGPYFPSKSPMGLGLQVAAHHPQVYPIS